jgi:signal transduction histidine kinase
VVTNPFPSPSPLLSVPDTLDGSLDRRRVVGLLLVAVVLLSAFEATQLAVRLALPTWSAPWHSLLVRTLVSWGVLGLLSVGAWHLALRVPLPPVAARSLLIHGASMTVFVLLHVLVTAATLTALNPSFRLSRTASYIGVAYVIFDVVLYAFVVGVANSWQFSRLATQRAVASAQLAESLERARFDALRRKLDPHFLFNTLNAIAALALKGNGPATADAIAVLSDLLRETLRENAKALHPVTRELAYIRDYLSIMQMRFPDRITLRTEVDEDAADAMIPCLVLQPLVENAVVHGLRNGSVCGLITIRAARRADMLTITVDDDGAGPPELTKEGIGLESLRARLEHAFGARARLTLGAGADGRGARSMLAVPFLISVAESLTE